MQLNKQLQNWYAYKVSSEKTNNKPLVNFSHMLNTQIIYIILWNKSVTIHTSTFLLTSQATSDN